MKGKRQERRFVASDEEREQARQTRHVADEHDFTLLAGQQILDQPWRVAGLQPFDGAEFGQRITQAQKRFGCLPRPQLAAVPDRHWLCAPRGCLGGEALGMLASRG